MDCEKFETTLIDELYEELDELTSAAAKRHVAGCARCSALLGGLKATRRIAVLPVVEPSTDFEERILAAAKGAEKVVPLERRVSHAISWAGSWAMRPQTAMAAVFLLMIGGSALFIRVSHKAAAPSSATMTITEEGSPAAAAVPVEEVGKVARVDPTAAAAAHGALAPPAAVATAAMPMGSAVAVAMPPPPSPAEAERSPGGPLAQLQPSDLGRGGGYGGSSNADPANADLPSAGAPYRAAPAPIAKAARIPMKGGSDDAFGAGEGQAQTGAAMATSALDAAMALYRSGKYDDAVRAFDALASGGDNGAALWAARSVREGNGGCAAAISRFDQVASRTFGTSVGYDAVLEGGRCLHSVGTTEAARTHFARLLTVPAYASRAQSEIDALSQAQQQVASRKSQMPPAPKPAAAAARPPSAQTPQQQAPKATDTKATY